MFQAYIEGYEDHLFDLKCIAVYTGYWAGYYGNSKRPKPLSKVLELLFGEHRKSKQKNQKPKERPGVDVEEFLRKEERLRAYKQRR